MRQTGEWIGATKIVRHTDGVFFVAVRDHGTLAVSETEAELSRAADAEFQPDAPLESRARYLAWVRFEWARNAL